MFPLTMFYDETKDKIEKLVDFVDDQVENIEDSIEKSLTHNNKIIDDFNEKLRMDGRIGRIFVNDRGQLSNDFADFDTMHLAFSLFFVTSLPYANLGAIFRYEEIKTNYSKFRCISSLNVHTRCPNKFRTRIQQKFYSAKIL